MQQQQDELSKIETTVKLHESASKDENNITEAEVVERVEKRFGKSLPTNRMNIILLMDMTHKHASIEQFEPLAKKGKWFFDLTI